MHCLGFTLSENIRDDSILYLNNGVGNIKALGDFARR